MKDVWGSGLRVWGLMPGLKALGDCEGRLACSGLGAWVFAPRAVGPWG